MPERGSKIRTYVLCIGININDQLRVDYSTSKGSLGMLMMRKEQAGDFPVGIVAVDLEQSERQIRAGREGVIGHTM
jgi:hypothetical protein